MNVATIKMDPQVAQAKLKAFRANVHKDSEEIYQQTARAYAHLAKGTPIISLTQAIQQAGRFDDHRPRVAIARADRQEVHFSWPSNRRDATFHAGDRSHQQRSPQLHITVDMGQPNPAFSIHQGKRYSESVDGFSLVPMLPADVRPAKGQLADWFILWEVERWFERSQTKTVDPDPLLLKHLGGDLYAVLAEWELTDIERLILNQVRR